MNGWQARVDRCVMWLGTVVANVGVLAQFAGFALAFVLDDPISGYAWIQRGWWIAGLGGAGIVYGIKADAGGSVEYPGGPVTYHPPACRWPAAIGALIGVPMWGVLSFPIGIMLYGTLIVGGCALGCVRAFQLARRKALAR